MFNLLLGDSFELIKTIPDGSVDLVIIDPPYELESTKGAGAFGTDSRGYHSELIELYKTQGNRKEAERLALDARSAKRRANIVKMADGFDISILDELERVMKKTNIYIWCSRKQLGKLINYYENNKKSVEVLTWHKTNPIPTCNNTYLSDTEYLIFAREKGVKLYGSYATKRKWYVTPANVVDKKKYGHPTIKPLEIIENLIINSSLEGDVVLDCFMGSGTTGVACAKLGGAPLHRYGDRCQILRNSKAAN